ncbi:MAG: hypothetical protein ACQETE_11095 [Bacteroidota bacterium]
MDFDVTNHDLSHLWLTEKPISYDSTKFIRPEPVGYLGDDYQRFFIHFTSVIQDQRNKLEYFAYGKTKLKNRIKSFQGKISIDSTLYLEDPVSSNTKEGKIIGSYLFFEDPTINNAGQYEGRFKTFVSLKSDSILYSTYLFGADGYNNNQFEGTWNKYSKSKNIVCNWGDFRIPDREGFDIGAGQMGVHSDYVDNGWNNFEIATFPIVRNDREKKMRERAREKEAEEWWK